MRDVFREILLEAEWGTPASYFKRATDAPRLRGKALAVIGVRRAGKTTYLRQLWDDLVRTEHTARERMVHVNFFDERLFGLSAARLGELLEAHYELYPSLEAREPLYIFLDEPQVIRGWEYFVERLLRAHHHVFLSGSSATLLSKEIATAMRGRSLSVEIFPFSFKEVLAQKGLSSGPLSVRQRASVRALLRGYLHEGGFPETLSVGPEMRRRLLQDYLDTVLLRDVIERHNPSDPVAITHLLHLLMNQVGSFYTLNKTTERLKAQGLKVNKPEISKAIEWLADSYLLFSIPIFAASAQKRLSNPRKLYCIDPGMAYHHGGTFSNDWGHLLENVIFLELRRRTEELFYFKNSYHQEVDLVMKEQGKTELVQVAWTLRDPKTRHREISSLIAGMNELGVSNATLVTFDEEEVVREQGKTIYIEPAWSYLREK